MSAAIALATAFPLFSPINETVTKSDQDVNYELLGDLDGNKVRVVILSNSFGFQSHARAEVWSKADLRWNVVSNLPYGAMKTPFGLCYKKDWNSVDHFRADAAYLVAQTAAIIL